MHAIFRSLETPPPDITIEEAATLLEEHYGLAGALSPLSSERDLNFLVRPASGGACVLKFANTSEAAPVTDFQNEALIHLARVRPDLPVPRVVDAIAGDRLVRFTAANGLLHSMRLLTWLEGLPLQGVEQNDGIAAQTGTRLAELGRALASFEHPAADYPLLWDIRNAAHLVELLPHVNDAELRKLCESRLELFENHTRPALDGLRKQVIHNDFNPSNMLVAEDDVQRLSGVIDFGDMVYSELVNDVAVAAAYFCKLDSDPFAQVIPMLFAYSAVVPLADEEIAVLPDMILTRHLTTVMITHWRASLYPENRDYILRNEPRARNMLRRVADLPVDETRDRFYEACRAAETTETMP
ncbi:MAG: phosphotransferase [Woeseiaceae bacterium]|jgi:Ser/Thr protein kinase RdoA (MazF antagonist)|nr:phosphotransferase [Woeseiaceae bacterium]